MCSNPHKYSSCFQPCVQILTRHKISSAIQRIATAGVDVLFLACITFYDPAKRSLWRVNTLIAFLTAATRDWFGATSVDLSESGICLNLCWNAGRDDNEASFVAEMKQRKSRQLLLAVDVIKGRLVKIESDHGIWPAWPLHRYVGGGGGQFCLYVCVCRIVDKDQLRCRHCSVYQSISSRKCVL